MDIARQALALFDRGQFFCLDPQAVVLNDNPQELPERSHDGCLERGEGLVRHAVAAQQSLRSARCAQAGGKECVIAGKTERIREDGHTLLLTQNLVMLSICQPITEFCIDTDITELVERFQGDAALGNQLQAVIIFVQDMDAAGITAGDIGNRQHGGLQVISQILFLVADHRHIKKCGQLAGALGNLLFEGLDQVLALEQVFNHGSHQLEGAQICLRQRRRTAQVAAAQHTL